MLIFISNYSLAFSFHSPLHFIRYLGHEAITTLLYHQGKRGERFFWGRIENAAPI
jgi:hypothetical protein